MGISVAVSAFKLKIPPEFMLYNVPTRYQVGMARDLE